MAGLREMHPAVQVLIFAVLGLGIVLGFEYVPGSPLQSRRAELEQKKNEAKALHDEVVRLQVYEQRKSELQREIEALNRQLEILRAIVPEDKEVDEFIRIVQGEASSSGVSIRRLTAKAVVPREYYAEMPFELEADGPYFNVLEFFSRLGKVPRVINVRDLAFTGISEAAAKKYPLRPGTTVTGVFMATGFFTKGAAGPATPGKEPAKR